MVERHPGSGMFKNSDRSGRIFSLLLAGFFFSLSISFLIEPAYSDPPAKMPAQSSPTPPASSPSSISLPTLAPSTPLGPPAPTSPLVAPVPSTPSSISQASIILEGQEAYRSGDYRRAHDLLEEALLDSGPAGLPAEAVITLASSSRRIGHSGRAIALLLPLLNQKGNPPYPPTIQRNIRYELAMADKDKGNTDGAIRLLLPIFSDLSRSRRIRHATGILLDHWRNADPVTGAVLMGQTLERLDPPDQKVVMTRTIDLIFGSVRNENGLLRILSSFPRDFPGDYAAYRLALLETRTHHPRRAEKILLRMILYYSESLYISEAEHLLNKISMGGKGHSIGLIIPDIARGPLRPYMRSILTGAVQGFGVSSKKDPSLIVRFVTGHENYAHWYDDLVKHERIVALIGPFMVSDFEVVRPRLVRDQILAITPTLPSDPKVRFLISMASLPSMVASAIASFSLSLVPNARAVILYPTDYYGKIFKASYEKALNSSGGSLKAAIPLTTGRGKRQEAVLKLRRFGENVQVPPKGPLPEGMNGRAGDFVSVGGKSYYLVYPPRTSPATRPNPFFFKPDFDIIVFPNDSLHPFKVLDELVYKNIQNVDVLANESIMMTRRRWDMVSDIHNPLYSVAPVNLFHLAQGHSSRSSLREAYSRLIQINGRSPDLLKLESYDCAAFLADLLRKGFRTRYHLGVKALSAKSYDGLSGPVFWGPEGKMGRVYTLYQFSGGDWKKISTQSISFDFDQQH